MIYFSIDIGQNNGTFVEWQLYNNEPSVFIWNNPFHLKI